MGIKAEAIKRVHAWLDKEEDKAERGEKTSLDFGTEPWDLEDQIIRKTIDITLKLVEEEG